MSSQVPSSPAPDANETIAERRDRAMDNYNGIRREEWGADRPHAFQVSATGEGSAMGCEAGNHVKLHADKSATQGDVVGMGGQQAAGSAECPGRLAASPAHPSDPTRRGGIAEPQTVRWRVKRHWPGCWPSLPLAGSYQKLSLETNGSTRAGGRWAAGGGLLA